MTDKHHTKYDLFILMDEHTRECKECAKRGMNDMIKNFYCSKREIVSEDLRDIREKLFKGLSTTFEEKSQ